jgi:hypothetical protein
VELVGHAPDRMLSAASRDIAVRDVSALCAAAWIVRPDEEL